MFMKRGRVFAVVLAIASAQAVALQAQDLFRLSFHATCRSLNDQGRLATTRINQTNLIARCVGTNDAFATNSPFALVFNATADSIQVVNLTNSALVCDVFQLQGVVSNSDGARLERLSFLFTPDQTNAVGNAITTE